MATRRAGKPASRPRLARSHPNALATSATSWMDAGSSRECDSSLPAAASTGSGRTGESVHHRA
jgi:hypothetical protein